MGAMDSMTLTAGPKEIEPIDAATGIFRMTATNKQTGETVTVRGFGLGAGDGVGFLPVDLSGDLPWLPSWHGEFYLGPAGNDSMGDRLFQGVAVIADVGAAVGWGVDYSTLSFMSTPTGGYSAVKLWTAMAGFDWVTNATAGGTWWCTLRPSRGSGFAALFQRNRSGSRPYSCSSMVAKMCELEVTTHGLRR